MDEHSQYYSDNLQIYNNNVNLQYLKNLHSPSTRLLWHLNYWDGPHSGVMLWNNQKCYFKSYEDITLQLEDPEFDETEYDPQELMDPTLKYLYQSVRFYKVYAVPPQTMSAFTHNHNMFDQYIGTHTNYDENGVKTGSVHGLDLDWAGLDNWPVVGKFKR